MDDGAQCGRCRRNFLFLGIGIWALSTCLPFRPAFVTPRGRQWACPARRASQCLALLPQSSEWLPVVNGPTVETDENITVLPVFPLSSVYWPGSEATLQIIDPAYRKMYDDILMSGSRRFVVTFTRSLPGGRVRYADMEEGDRRLFSIGSLLYLTDLEEVSGQTDGHVKYVAKHEVQGRVQLLRLLNPSALFETDGKGNKVNYLRAEARILPEEEKNPGEDGEESWRPELLESWQDFQSLAQKFEEPHIAGDFFSKVAPRVSSGILAAAWQQLQVQTQMVRRQKRAMEEVKKIIEEGRMSQKEALELVFQKAGPLDLGWDFWEQLLPLLAANSWQRGELLLGLVREELKLAKTRFALKEALK